MMRISPTSLVSTVHFTRAILPLSLVAVGMIIAGCQHSSEGIAKREPPPVAEISGDVAVVETVPWTIVAEVQGSLLADEVTTVAARVPGRIVEVNCDLGDLVNAGQILFQIDEREFKLRIAQNQAQLEQSRAAIGLKEGASVDSLDPVNSPPVREARALLDEAQQVASRAASLLAQNAISATEVESARSAEQVADARYNSALNSVREKMAAVDVQTANLELAKQELEDTQITAPYTGMVQQRLVSIGTYVQVGQPLLQLSRTTTLRYQASVPERLSRMLQLGQPVKVRLSDSILETRITRISPVLDPMNRSMVFEADIENSDNLLRAGMFAAATVVLDNSATATAIPTSALVRFAGVEKVFRITAEDDVKEAVVRVGREMDGKLEVLEGLEVGDRVLVQGSLGRTGKYVGNGNK